MRALALLIAVTVLCFAMTFTGCSTSSSDANSNNATQGNAASTQPKAYGVILNITRGKDDLHAVSMAVALGIHALEDGHDSTIFLNVHAPELAIKDLGDDVQYADFPPVRAMFKTFMEKGGTLYACEHCTGCCGVENANLLDGIVLTKHAKLLAELDGNSLVFSY